MTWNPSGTSAKGGTGIEEKLSSKAGDLKVQKLRGAILPGGGDWETIQDHDGDLQAAHLDTRYNPETHDGVCIFLKTTGTRTGKKAVLEGLGEEGKHAPDKYRMRLHMTFESGDERYRWLNSIIAIASSARDGRRVIYDAYQVL